MYRLNKKLPIFATLSKKLTHYVAETRKPEESKLTFSYSESTVLSSCFLRKSTTSSTFRLVIIERAIEIHFFLTSISGLDSTPRRSSTRGPFPLRSVEYFSCSVERRSRTISLTLLSG